MKKKQIYEKPELIDFERHESASANCQTGASYMYDCRNGSSASANRCNSGANPYNAGCAAGNRPAGNENCRVGNQATNNCRNGNQATNNNCRTGYIAFACNTGTSG